VAGVRGANVGSRDVNWREWLIGSSRGCRRPTQCLPYAARDVSVIGSWLKSPTTLLELCRIVPANSLPRLGPAAASRQLLQQKT